jgi:hypothetical protein
MKKLWVLLWQGWVWQAGSTLCTAHCWSPCQPQYCAQTIVLGHEAFWQTDLSKPHDCNGAWVLTCVVMYFVSLMVCRHWL